MHTKYTINIWQNKPTYGYGHNLTDRKKGAESKEPRFNCKRSTRKSNLTTFTSFTRTTTFQEEFFECLVEFAQELFILPGK